MEILYWHWVLLGVGLMLLEIALPSFTALWFGVAAVVVGVLLYFVPDMSLSLQVVVWTILSGLLTWLWFRYLKPLSIDKTKAGLSREAIVGEIGQVLEVPTGERRGKLRFPAPVLGSDEWMIISQDDLVIGDRVRVVDVSGNSLIVVKN
ncbi:MAG: NfeD family protein [Chromatiales bacterium]|jgi:membrane protein implicated in regulation of membrane protease activity